ncbi:hypothetical protein B296_00006507 [Ensete ventricosum]|uniref:Isopenicillin N synthase-like Fe(2+) 2OG dioxygenase domain-containing protein n=1 Tax=Ensete ventricosum TaxID=4639 RepID=A0A427AAT1_ENSVE|nr:hypothetical protein B296_00006507 [Ensete ventricosum]
MASSSASSAGDAVHHHGFDGGVIPSPPPPTPSNQSRASSHPADADAALPRLLHQLLAAPLRPDLSPVIYFDQPPPSDLLRAASDFGFFHLAATASPPLSSNRTRILMLDTGGRVAGDEFASLPALLEFGKCLEKVGLGMVDMLSSMKEGFCEKPLSERSYTQRCLIWISSYDNDINTDKTGSQMRKSKCYPYVVGLQYEMNWWKQPYLAIGDSNELISIAPVADSILVTHGDIAQVWSNGRFKRVRSRPQPTSLPFDGFYGTGCISLTVLVTVPFDTLISPLLPSAAEGCGAGNADEGDEDDGRRFHAF